MKLHRLHEDISSYFTSLGSLVDKLHSRHTSLHYRMGNKSNGFRHCDNGQPVFPMDSGSDLHFLQHIDNCNPIAECDY